MQLIPKLIKITVEHAQFNNFIQKTYLPNLALIFSYSFFKCGLVFNNLWNFSVFADFFFSAFRTEADVSCKTK